jgi:hypothetical protein
VQYVEIRIVAWKRIIWVAAGFLFLAGGVSLITGRVRLVHLLTSAVVVLSVPVTLVFIHLIGDPEHGDLGRYPVGNQILAAAIQGSYAAITLVILAATRRPAPVN